jgi:hypothetical protein
VALAHRDRSDSRVDAARDDHANRDLSEVRGVSGVSGAGAGVETHLAVDPAAELPLQRAQVDL